MLYLRDMLAMMILVLRANKERFIHVHEGLTDRVLRVRYRTLNDTLGRRCSDVRHIVQLRNEHGSAGSYVLGFGKVWRQCEVVVRNEEQGEKHLSGLESLLRAVRVDRGFRGNREVGEELWESICVTVNDLVRHIAPVDTRRAGFRRFGRIGQKGEERFNVPHHVTRGFAGQVEQPMIGGIGRSDALQPLATVRSNERPGVEFDVILSGPIVYRSGDASPFKAYAV